MATVSGARFMLSDGQPDPQVKTIDRLIELTGKRPAEVARILQARIEQLDRETDSRYCLEYCSTYPSDSPTRAAAPIRDRYRWAIVYPVTGGSEGHYLHVALIYQRDETGAYLHANEYREIVMIKIFGGWDAAAELAGRIGRWIDA
jgi:hypothetical protein